MDRKIQKEHHYELGTVKESMARLSEKDGCIEEAKRFYAGAMEHYEKAEFFTSAGITAEKAGLPGRAIENYEKAKKTKTAFIIF